VLAPISAFNFNNEIALEIGSGFQLEDDDLRLGARYDRYHGQFHATNFKDDITLVKLMSARAGERFAVAFRVLGGNEGRLNTWVGRVTSAFVPYCGATAGQAVRAAIVVRTSGGQGTARPTIRGMLLYRSTLLNRQMWAFYPCYEPVTATFDAL
jgi:hypothetical protein